MQPVTGLEPLFDAANRGRLTMLDDMENVIAAALCHLKLPLNSVDPAHLMLAKELLLSQKPLVQAYTSDSYRERLISGEAWAALGWSGDLLQADTELLESGGQARVAVVVPPQGTMLWMDSMVIPVRAQRVDLAHAFIDFLLEPKFAALNAQKVNYATPNRAARALLPADMLANESIYLPDELVDRCTWLEDRGDQIEKIERVWRSVRG
jgi:spermidine/putrescine-binding protein